MPGRVTKAKGHRHKGEKKKKEEKVLPLVVDITVNLSDAKQLELKGITTDKLLDVRQLLVQNTDSLHVTNYSFSHEVRGSNLPDSMELTALKPCVLDLVEESYTEEAVVVHVRRLLDIVACTTAFGSSKQDRREAEEAAAKPESPSDASAVVEIQPSDAVAKEEDTGADEQDAPKGLGLGLAVGGKKKKEPEVVAEAKVDEKALPKNEEKALQKVDESTGQIVEVGNKGVQELYEQTEETRKAALAMAEAEAAAERGDMTGMCPPSQLGAFYEFFSISHLTPPLQSIRRSSRALIEEGALMALDVKLCNGKLVPVVASADGFSVAGKPASREHSLLDLLKRQSGAFTAAYDALMKAFNERNQFGNVPLGFRHNTWVAPPPFASAPTNPQPFPVEDELWGGNGGGGGIPGGPPLTDSEGGDETIRWVAQFEALAKMPCATQDERVARDRKAFLLHNLFADITLRAAAAAASEAAEAGTAGEVELHRGHLLLRVSKDSTVAGAERHVSNCGPFRVVVDGAKGVGGTKHPGGEEFDEVFLKEELDRRNLLKGLTADESAAVQDLPTLGMVVMHHRGYTVKAHALGKREAGEPEVDVFEVRQPEGGANALNINSLRSLLPRSGPSLARAGGPREAEARSEHDAEADDLVKGVLQESIAALEADKEPLQHVQRWESGACWLQHLQNPPAPQGGAKAKNGVVEVKESEGDEGVGKEESEEEKAEKEDRERRNQEELKARVSEEAFKRLEDSKTGLHLKSLDELMAGAREYHDKVALPKLVADFGSLELSPVDGRTLTEFMHTRGLNMHSLGAVAKEAKDLTHVRSLAVHEMVTRAYKHILRAVIAAAHSKASVAPAIAAALNACLGTHKPEEDSFAAGALMWQWTLAFCKRQFDYELPAGTQEELRKLSILRGLANKVGLEIAPRDFELDTATPFKAADIVALFPIYKHVACTSADGRALLEQSKTALDKGKLDDAVTFGAKALAKLIAVCGPRHRMTAGAYSLLAVVLYHTGDFNQATIYQQKALDINERELGFDHPDTMKSYGDLAVFYYRLQHTELALKYVNRALYLLHLTCGPDHPNTVATYINVAMMEEGMGNIPLALRYLHEALKRNQRLLGVDHIQTAASYHAIAIALSLMEAYALSVQHEQITLQILQEKLGPDDLRTQDAAAWLDYFDSKAVEQVEAARTGARKPDASIASKGHLSVDDLLKYINKGAPSSPPSSKKAPPLRGGGQPAAKRPPTTPRNPASSKHPPRPTLDLSTPSGGSSVTASDSDSDQSDGSDAPTATPPQATPHWPGSPTAAPEVLVGAVAAPPPTVEDDGGEWQPAAPRSKAGGWLNQRRGGAPLGGRHVYPQQGGRPSPRRMGGGAFKSPRGRAPARGALVGVARSEPQLEGAVTTVQKTVQEGGVRAAPAEGAVTAPSEEVGKRQEVKGEVTEAPPGGLLKTLSWKEVALAPPGKYSRSVSPPAEELKVPPPPREEGTVSPPPPAEESTVTAPPPAVEVKVATPVPKPEADSAAEIAPAQQHEHLPPASDSEEEEGVQIKTVDPGTTAPPPRQQQDTEVEEKAPAGAEKVGVVVVPSTPLNPEAPVFKVSSPKPLNPEAPVFQSRQGVLPTPPGGPNPNPTGVYMPPLYQYSHNRLALPVPVPLPYSPSMHAPPLVYDGGYVPASVSPGGGPMNPNAAEFVPGRSWTPSPPLMPTPGGWEAQGLDSTASPVVDNGAQESGAQEEQKEVCGEQGGEPVTAQEGGDEGGVPVAAPVPVQSVWARAKSWANILDTSAEQSKPDTPVKGSRKEVAPPVTSAQPQAASEAPVRAPEVTAAVEASEGSSGGNSDDDGFVVVTRKKRKENGVGGARSPTKSVMRSQEGGVGIPAKARTGGAGRERMPAAQVVSVR